MRKKEWVEFCKGSVEYQKLLKLNPPEVVAVSKNQNELKQPTLSDMLTKRIPWPDDHPVSLRIDKSIMDLIIVDMLPYNLVQGEAFRRLNFADPETPSRYRHKTEKYYRTTLMNSTYEKVKKKVVLLLEKAKWVSFTTDIWTNPSKSCSLLSCTAHFIVESKRKKVILAAMPLEQDHTGQFIAIKLKECVNAFNLTDKIHMGIRDNASNMIAAMRCGNFTSIGCVAHTLQLVIRDVLFKDLSAMEIVKKCRKIVGHFKKSEQANRYLSKFQEKCGLPKHVLLQDVDTRWNSTYLMLERMVEQKSAINLYMAERGGIAVLTAREWIQMTNYLTVLKCFYQATIEVSNDSSATSIIIPLIAMLNSKLSPNDQDSEDIILLKSNLCESINRRFGYARKTSQLLIATLIDPRFKTKYLTNDEIQNTKTEIISFLTCNTPKSIVTNNLEKDNEDTEPSCSTIDPTIGNQSTNDDNLWETHDKMPRTVNDCEFEDTQTKLMHIEKHLADYLKEPLLLRNADIYEYWASSPYIPLRLIALKYLSAPPTSVPSEQLFSTAGQIYDDRRSNLRGENVDKLLFLAYNIRLFEYVY